MKVFWGRGWLGSARGQLPGEEVCVNKTLEWADETWLVPSVYVCGQGLVIDVCRPVNWSRMQAFMDKWQLNEKSSEADFAPDQHRQLAREHPLENRMELKMQLNGRVLRPHSSSGFSYMMDGSAEDPDAQEMLAHYELDRSCAWTFTRFCFGWATTRKPRICSLQATFVHDRMDVDGARFALAPGGQITLTHPVTGAAHTLIVQKEERIFVHENAAACLLQYTTQPALSRAEMTLRDCEAGAGRRRMHRSAIGLIGGVSGCKTAVSSLYDVNDWPREMVWQAVFHVKTAEDAQLQLI